MLYKDYVSSVSIIIRNIKALYAERNVYYELSIEYIS